MTSHAPPPRTWVPAHTEAVVGALVNTFAAARTDALYVLHPLTDATGTITDFDVLVDTGQLADWVGQPVLGRRVTEFLPEALAQRTIAAHRDTLLSGDLSSTDYVVTYGPNGARLLAEGSQPKTPADVIVNLTYTPMNGMLVVVGRDITSRQRHKLEQEAAERRYRSLLDRSNDPIVVTDANGLITYASEAVRTVFHYDPKELVGEPLWIGDAPEEQQVEKELVERAVAGEHGSVHTCEVRITDPQDGSFHWAAMTARNWLADPTINGIVVNIREITEMRETGLRLEREAMQDSLTGLPNRRWFLRDLDHAAGATLRTGQPFGILLVDVDGFKGVNDTHGHPVGDELLVVLAERMTHAVRPTDTVARLGGDEFVIIARELRGPADAMALATRLLDTCVKPYLDVLVPGEVTLSIGIATSDDVPNDGHTMDTAALMRHADKALYEAKRRGRNRVEVFDPSMGMSGATPR